ncbi:MAG: sigma-70 family RNA polymerase sigma factor [Leptospira sp.]|nr:sigma-70 family RNA polymerase sigma factor [Leptospira sp.]
MNQINNYEDVQIFIERLIFKSPAAWREFIILYNPVITGVVRYYAPHLDADEIAQKVYEKCIKDECAFLRHFEGNSPLAFRSYLVKTTKFIVQDERKKFLRMQNSQTGEEHWEENFLSNEPTAEERIESQEITDTLQKAIMQLEFNQRQVVYFLLQGLTNREIAEILGCPLNTVLSWSRRAKMKLKEILETESILK